MKNIKKFILIGIGVLTLFLLLYIFFLSTEKVNNINNKNKYNETRTYFELNDEELDFIEIEKKESVPFRIFFKNREILDSYKIDGFKKVPINNVACETVFNFIRKIDSSHIFLPRVDLEEYGLKNPSFIFKAKTKKGKDFIFKVGAKTKTGDGYYFMLEGIPSGEIAVVETFKLYPVLKDKLEYVNLKLIPEYTKTFGEDKKYNGDGVQACFVGGKDLDEGLKFSVDDNGNVFVVSPKDFKLSENIKNSIEKAPSLLVAKEVFRANPTDEEIKNCGLKTPKRYIEYSIDYNKYVIKIGNVAKVEHVPNTSGKKDSVDVLKYYYLSINNADVIYIVSENLLPWLKF